MDVINYRLEAGTGLQEPEIIVVHAMSEFIHFDGQDLHATEFLRRIGLSAHRLITPNGDMIKCKQDTEVAAHAKGHNKNSLGVEFLMKGLQTYDEFIENMKSTYLTEAQLENGAYVISSWADKWNISIQNIVTHQQIDPNRKHDPGVEGARILAAVKALM